MSYRHNPHGYYDNPRADDDEAESQRVMAVVQHVLDRVGFREVRHALDQAKEQKKLNPLIADALKIMQSLSFPKKFLEVASAALVKPESVSSTFGVAKAYYLDGNKPPYSSDDDPGVFVDDLSDYSTYSTPLATQMRRRGPGGGLRSTDFLTRFWPQVTDSDVQNAVAISQEEGVSFYRKYKISEDDWVAKHGPDSVEDYTGSHYVKKDPRSRDEFLRSRVSLRFDAVLRVNVGRTVRELRDIDLEPDDVVYRHGGTNNSIGGASGRGFYVAQLRPGQLIPEGMSPPVGLGICLGGEDYQRYVREGELTIYGIRAPSGKPKFAISVDDTGIEQVKGAANRLPGFDPGSGEFKGEAGVDEVRAVVEFLMIFLGMKPQDEAFEGPNLEPGILAMRRAGIDPFSPPVKGQTWERALKERQAKMEDMRRQYVALRVAYSLARYPPADDVTLSQPDDDELRQWATDIYRLQDDLRVLGGSYVMQQAEEEIKKQLPTTAAERVERFIELELVLQAYDTGFVTLSEAEHHTVVLEHSSLYNDLHKEQGFSVINQAQEEAYRRFHALRLPPLPPPPARRQNPDPLASYSDPEVAALALAAYERPMGGMWTYEDEEEE
jgi:hypothetical protein